MKGSLTENFKIVTGTNPSADMYNSSPATDVVNMEGYNRVHFIVHQTKNATSTAGTATLTVEQCTSAAGAGNEAIAFKYRKKTTGASEVWGNLTAAAAAGFTTTANEDTIYVIEVQDQDLDADSKFVRLKMTEVADAPVIGSVIIMLSGGRYKDPNFDAALT